MVVVESGRIETEYGYNVNAAGVGGIVYRTTLVEEEVPTYLRLIDEIVKSLNLDPKEVKAGDANLGFTLSGLRKKKYEFTGKTFAEIQEELKEMNIARKVARWNCGKEYDGGWSRGTDFEHFMIVETPILGLERLFSTPYAHTTGISKETAHIRIMREGDLDAGALLHTKIQTEVNSSKFEECMTEERKGKHKDVGVTWDMLLFYKRK